MKRIVLWIGIALLLVGCNYMGNREEENRAEKNRAEENRVVTQSAVTQKKQQIYCEKKVDLGLGEESTIQLTADEDAVSGKKLLINGTGNLGLILWWCRWYLSTILYAQVQKWGMEYCR